MKVGTWRWSLSFLIISVGLYISLSRLLIFIFLWEGRQLFFSSVGVLRNDVSLLFLSRESCGSSHMAKCHEITFSVLWSSCFTRLEAVSLRAETPFSRISTGLWPRVTLAIISMSAVSLRWEWIHAAPRSIQHDCRIPLTWTFLNRVPLPPPTTDQYPLLISRYDSSSGNYRLAGWSLCT